MVKYYKINIDGEGKIWCIKAVQGFDYAMQTLKHAEILGRYNVGDQ